MTLATDRLFADLRTNVGSLRAAWEEASTTRAQLQKQRDELRRLTTLVTEQRDLIVLVDDDVRDLDDLDAQLRYAALNFGARRRPKTPSFVVADSPTAFPN